MKVWNYATNTLSRAGLLFLLFTIIAGCGPSDATHQETGPIASGQENYVAYCMDCHGPEGKGDGPVAELLAIPPPDLTLLSQKHNGAFPAKAVYDQIDGRGDVRSHGTREMPVWGNIWSEENGTPRPAEEAEQMINEVVEYLRSIQDTTMAM